MEKICKITNDTFSWVMEVDGKRISFNLQTNAEYFEEHYKSLGYKVERVNW